jgi:hypothetical protein
MTEKQEIVSGKLLREVFSSRTFVSHVLKAACTCRKEKRETDFSVIKRLGSEEICYTDIRIGGFDSMYGAPMSKQYKQILLQDDSAYKLINVHFHPDSDITPSEGDLKIPVLDSFYQGRAGFRFKPIHGVGVEFRSQQTIVPILLYQMKKCPEDFEEFYNSLRENIVHSGKEFIMQDDFFAFAFRRSRKRLKRKKIHLNKIFQHSEYPYIVADELRKGGYYKTAVLNIYPDSGVYESDLKAVSQFSFKVKRYKP